MDLEGELLINYEAYCEDFINILLKNGYTLSMELVNNNKNLKILYYKHISEIGGKHGR